MLTLHLRDLSEDMTSAWKSQFRSVPEASITCGDIFGVTADAIVSPANSFGFMDGGIDLAYSKHFGWQVQERLQAHLHAQHGGELPVGQAVIIPTEHESIPWLISAPTMRVPEDVSSTTNAYLAFRAALRAIKQHNANASTPIRSVLCPGLGTAVGRMPPARCAYQMHAAWLNVVEHSLPMPSLGQARELHTAMLHH